MTLEAIETMEKPTRRVERTQNTDGYEERAFEPVCSVELGETAKGDVQVKSVKVYAATVEEAGNQALAEFLRLKAEINANGSNARP